MIQAKRLGHVVLNVRDAEQSRDFYTQTLGLKVAHENLERGALFLSFGKEHHDLALFQQATGEPPARTQPGLHHVAWRLDNFEELKAAYQELKRMGIPLDSTAEHNVTRSVYLWDPDGNRVELYSDMVENGFETMQSVGPKRAPTAPTSGTSTATATSTTGWDTARCSSATIRPPSATPCASRRSRARITAPATRKKWSGANGCAVSCRAPSAFASLPRAPRRRTWRCASLAPPPASDTWSN